MLEWRMAWGNKKKRELEYQKSGQSAALEIGDLGAADVYDTNADDFKASWELEPDDVDIGEVEIASLEPAGKP